MKAKFFLMMLAAAAIPAAATALEKEAKLKVTGMFCADCSSKVKGALEKQPGVIAVDVNFETNSATVKYDDSKTDPAALADAVTDAGYESSTAQ